MDSIPHPWEGDWKLRLSERLKRIGFTTLEEFLDAHPGVDYVKLARKFGERDIAALQIYGEHIRHASIADCLRDAAKDSFVRFLSEHLKHGWGRGRHFDFRWASAIAAWKSCLIQFGTKPANFAVQLDAVTN